MLKLREVSLRDEVRCGTAVAMTLGGSLGLAVALAFLVSEHADLVLDGSIERLASVVFMTSVGALLSVACMLPFELFATILRATTTVSFSSRRFYASVWIAGVVFGHVFLWTFTNAIRDIGTPVGLAASAALGVAALSLIVLAARGWRVEIESPANRARWSLLVGTLVALLAMAYLSYSELAPRLRATVDVPEANSASDVASAAARPPNIILISIDMLRADHVSAYGYPRATTPHIDRLAQDGALFTRAFSQAPWTLPSHATMLTGQYSSRHGARFYSSIRLFAYVADELRPFNVTLAETLSGAGYQTAGFTSMDWLSSKFGFDQGFDRFDNLPRGERQADKVVDRALSWMKTKDAGTPFFLFLHFFDVHEFEAPNDFYERYVDPDYRGLFTKADPRRGNLHDRVSDADLDHLTARYDAALAYVDSELGRFFDALEGADLQKGTLLIVTSDHGEEFWDHGGLGHGLTLYREQLHVPLVIRPPEGQPRASKQVDVLSGLLDLAPTIVDYAGLPHVATHQGVSLRPLIEGRGAAQSRLLFAEDTFFFNTYAVLTDAIKFICNRMPPPDLLNPRLLPANLRGFYRYRGDELYRTDVDPNEQINVVSSHRELSDELDALLVDHLETARVFEAQALDEELVERLRALGYAQ